MLIRLNKFLSDSGVCSRRNADKLIESGAVKVEKKTVKELGTKIDSKNSQVFVHGKPVDKKEKNVYYVLNKPVGYITTSKDPRRRKKVTDLVPTEPRVYPVGRLDYDSSGLIILTNDGDFAYKMSHPKFEKEKEYAIVARATKKYPDPNNQHPIGSLICDILLKGTKLEEGIAKADEIRIIEQKNDKIEFEMVIHQGWNRQIRRMCEAVGLKVISLKRVRVGDIKLGNLKEGEWRELKFDI